MRLAPLVVFGLCLALHRPARAAPCQVEGELYVERVTVRPDGAAPFDVGLTFASGTAELPTRAGRPMPVEIKGGLVFQAEIARPVLTVTRAVTSLDGVAMMRPGAQVIDARDADGVVLASLVLDVADRASGDDEPEVVLRELALPCGALSLDERARVVVDHAGDPIGRIAPGYNAPAGKWITRRPGALPLRPRPEADAPIHWLTATRCVDQRFALPGVWREGEWIQIARGGEGAIVRGWVHRRDLERLSAGEVLADAATCGPDDEAGRAATGGSADRGRPARLLAGARVFAREGSGEWARAERALAVSFVPIPGSAWVQLRSIERLDGVPSDAPLEHAFVPRDQLLPLGR